MEAAKTKERQLNLAKETLKKDSNPQMLELERNIWKSAAVSVPLKAAAKAPAQMIEDSNRREWSARSAKEDSASQQSGRGSSARSTGKPVEIDDISILPGTVS